MPHTIKKFRLVIILFLIVIVPIGLYTKFYAGPARAWISNSMGGLIYEVFWCLVVGFLVPRARPVTIALWVFLSTCFLEFLQLWHPPLLEFIRSWFLGRTLLGTSFNWLDFPYYAAGCLAGWYALRIIGKTAGVNLHTSGQP